MVGSSSSIVVMIDSIVLWTPGRNFPQMYPGSTSSRKKQILLFVDVQCINGTTTPSFCLQSLIDVVCITRCRSVRRRSTSTSCG